MSCSQCYTAQVPECIEFLDIYTSLIDITNEVTVVIKIVNNHGNIYLIDGFYLDGIVSVEFTNSSLPKNLFNRYSGAIKIEVYDKHLQTQLQMSFCDNPTIYDCIVIDKIEMNNDVENITTSTIGCVS